MSTQSSIHLSSRAGAILECTFVGCTLLLILVFEVVLLKFVKKNRGGGIVEEKARSSFHSNATKVTSSSLKKKTLKSAVYGPFFVVSPLRKGWADVDTLK